MFAAWQQTFVPTENFGCSRFQVYFYIKYIFLLKVQQGTTHLQHFLFCSSTSGSIVPLLIKATLILRDHDVKNL